MPKTLKIYFDQKSNKIRKVGLPKLKIKVVNLDKISYNIRKSMILKLEKQANESAKSFKEIAIPLNKKNYNTRYFADPLQIDRLPFWKRFSPELWAF